MLKNPFNMSPEQIASYSEQTLLIMEAMDKPQVHEDMIFCAPLNVEQVQITEEI
jgi:hypothetical protein